MNWQLLAHRAWNPPPSSLAKETTPSLAPPPRRRAISRRSQLIPESYSAEPNRATQR
jgi:hypothetical protein